MKRTMVRLGLSLALLVSVVSLVPRVEAAVRPPYNPCSAYYNQPPGCSYTWSAENTCCYANQSYCMNICW